MKISLGFVIVLLLFQPLFALAGTNDSLKWIRTPVPSNFDLKNVVFFTPEEGVAYGKQILIYNNDKWANYPAQPPVSINLAFPVNARSFFISSETKFQGSGRIIVIADSGFIGSDNTIKPGPGQITKGDNLAFIINCLEWLSKKVIAPYPLLHLISGHGLVPITYSLTRFIIYNQLRLALVPGGLIR